MGLPQPRPYDLRLVQDWLGRNSGGDCFLKGEEDRPWLDSEKDDLVALSSNRYDGLTDWIAQRLFPWAQKHRILRRASCSASERSTT
jgi:hypothetical protein